MKVGKTYLLLVTIIGLVSLSIYSTYAMFTASLDIGGFVNLTAVNLPADTNIVEYERLTLSASETKTIDFNITNSTDSSLYYGVWYEMVEPTSITDDIVIAKLDTSASETIGQLSTNGSSVVTLLIENNSADLVVINIGAAYSETSSLNLPTNRNIVTEEASSEVIATDKIISLSKGNTWESGASGVYETSYTKEDGTVIGKDYRYIGANVDNYINFNNDLYRIIGIFDENTHGIENEYLIKIIPKDFLTVNSWGMINTQASGGTYSTRTNDWTGKEYTTPASANILLSQYFLNKTNTSDTYGNCEDWTYIYTNNDYKTYNCDFIVGYGINDTYRNYIETVTWHLNGYNGGGLTSNNFYLCERGMYTGCSSSNNGGGDASISAKIGLMYVSDYIYASGYKTSDSDLIGTSIYCGSQNWLFQGEEWTITPYYSNAYFGLHIASNGPITYFYTYGASGLRPTFYLKSDTKITGGDGTFDNPYTIE